MHLLCLHLWLALQKFLEQKANNKEQDERKLVCVIADKMWRWGTEHGSENFLPSKELIALKKKVVEWKKTFHHFLQLCRTAVLPPDLFPSTGNFSPFNTKATLKNHKAFLSFEPLKSCEKDALACHNFKRASFEKKKVEILQQFMLQHKW